MKIMKSESNVFCGTSEITYCDEEVSQLSHSDIKLFKIELSKYYAIVDNLLKILSPIEVQRAERYLQLKDRNRFIISRSLLKYVLAKETGLDISKIQFEKSSSHKPYLPSDLLVFFNVSHTGNYAVIAVGDCEMGVDLEFIDNQFDFTEIIPNVFNDSEIHLIRTSKDPIISFYKLWTRKEAIVKSIGKGIDDDFIIIPATDGLHKVSSLLMNGYSSINVFSFNLNADYVGALALTENMILKNIICYPLPSPNELKFFIHDQLK